MGNYEILKNYTIINFYALKQTFYKKLSKTDCGTTLQLGRENPEFL